VGQAHWTTKDPTFKAGREGKNHQKNKGHSYYSKSGHVDGMKSREKKKPEKH